MSAGAEGPARTQRTQRELSDIDVVMSQTQISRARATFEYDINDGCIVNAIFAIQQNAQGYEGFEMILRSRDDARALALARSLRPINVEDIEESRVTMVSSAFDGRMHPYLNVYHEAAETANGHTMRPIPVGVWNEWLDGQPRNADAELHVQEEGEEEEGEEEEEDDEEYSSAYDDEEMLARRLDSAVVYDIQVDELEGEPLGDGTAPVGDEAVELHQNRRILSARQHEVIAKYRHVVSESRRSIQNTCKCSSERTQLCLLLDVLAEHGSAVTQQPWGINGGAPRPVPNEFFCPVHMAAMTCPVTTSEGITYEESAIYKVLFDRSFGAWVYGDGPVSPVTNEGLDPHFVPNRALRSLMDDWPETYLPGLVEEARLRCGTEPTRKELLANMTQLVTDRAKTEERPKEEMWEQFDEEDSWQTGYCRPRVLPVTRARAKHHVTFLQPAPLPAGAISAGMPRGYTWRQPRGSVSVRQTDNVDDYGYENYRDTPGRRRMFFHEMQQQLVQAGLFPRSLDSAPLAPPPPPTPPTPNMTFPRWLRYLDSVTRNADANRYTLPVGYNTPADANTPADNDRPPPAEID